MSVLVWAAMGLAGGAGALARYGLLMLVELRMIGPGPVGILLVNLSGALVIGITAGAGLDGDARLIVATGFLGGYTTFSTWMLETQRLTEERQIWPAIANLVVSVVLGVAAAMLGQWIAGLL